MQEHTSGLPLQEAIKLASTPKGQAILQQLQQEHGNLFQQAVQQAQSGDYDAIKKIFSGLLNSQEGKQLLDELRR